MYIFIDDNQIHRISRPAIKLPPIDLKPVFQYLENVELSPLASGALIAWGALGFYRGCRRQVYLHNANLKRYELTNKGRKPEHIYFMTGICGAFTSFAYLIPGINLFYMAKELWRLELYLRGVEVDTESFHYNRLCM
jgi:hypothetical protein